MATRNLAPRANGEGSLGTASKKWGSVYANDVIVGNRSITSAATSSNAGMTKLYDSTGTNTDGTMTQNAVTSAINTLNTEVTVAQEDIASLQSAMTMTYKAKGSVAFANLPSTLDATKCGWVYNVYDDFTTDNRFIEGSGVEYFSGENVVIVEVSENEYKFDVMTGFIDLSNYVQTSTLTGNYAKVTGWNSSTGTLMLTK